MELRINRVRINRARPVVVFGKNLIKYVGALTSQTAVITNISLQFMLIREPSYGSSSSFNSFLLTSFAIKHHVIKHITQKAKIGSRMCAPQKPTYGSVYFLFV